MQMRALLRWSPFAHGSGVLAAVAIAASTGPRTASATVLQQFTRTPAERSDSAREAAALEVIASRRQVVMDSAKQVRQENCPVPLTGLLRLKSNAPKDWAIPWESIRPHLVTLIVEEAAGEKDHVLKPVQLDGDRDTVKASIASITGTETMSETEALESLRCGKVIARIISSGNHDVTEIKKDTNWLVISRTQPPDAPWAAWFFVLLNPGQNERVSLDQFKYTPHVTGYGSPRFSRRGRDVRMQATRELLPRRYRGQRFVEPAVQLTPATAGFKLSAAAEDCLARGWKACFIDPSTSTSGDDGGWFGYDIERRLVPGGSEPWVPCPLYGCCCGGTKCHT